MGGSELSRSMGTHYNGSRPLEVEERARGSLRKEDDGGDWRLVN